MSDRPGQNGDADTLMKGPLHINDAAYSMKPGDIQIVAESAANVVVLTLPAMSDAIPGQIYSIYAPAGASFDVSVFIKETATEHGDGDLDAAGDAWCGVCTGESWLTVGSVQG